MQSDGSVTPSSSDSGQPASGLMAVACEEAIGLLQLLLHYRPLLTFMSSATSSPPYLHVICDVLQHVKQLGVEAHLHRLAQLAPLHVQGGRLLVLTLTQQWNSKAGSAAGGATCSEAGRAWTGTARG